MMNLRWIGISFLRAWLPEATSEIARSGAFFNYSRCNCATPNYALLRFPLHTTLPLLSIAPGAIISLSAGCGAAAGGLRGFITDDIVGRKAAALALIARE